MLEPVIGSVWESYESTKVNLSLLMNENHLLCCLFHYNLGFYQSAQMVC